MEEGLKESNDENREGEATMAPGGVEQCSRQITGVSYRLLRTLFKVQKVGSDQLQVRKSSV